MKSKLFQTLVITGAITTSLFAQQTPDEELKILSNDSSDRNTALNAINNRFSNLPIEVRQKYFGMKQNAYRYFSNKRTFESMMVLYEMMEIFDEDPQVFNLLGSIHIEFRNFNRARDIFTQALNLSIGDSMLLFNLAEIEFCTSNWETALKRFEQLKKETAGQQETELNKLISLKVMLCNLALAHSDNKKIDNSKKATYLDTAKKLANKYDYLDDTPYYYYSQAALAFHEEDRIKASQWLTSAQNVFGSNPASLASWNDTFIEFGYITSHYGTDEELEQKILESVIE